VPQDESVISGKSVIQRREITPDGRFVVKHIDIKTDGRNFIERVRLFTRSELEGMLTRGGFHVEARFGDYDGSALTDESKRVILFARRN
jgi:hypothetical protein